MKRGLFSAFIVLFALLCNAQTGKELAFQKWALTI